jgi:hypothetical protein
MAYGIITAKPAGIMSRRTRSNLLWAGVVLLAIAGFIYFSESAMTWLRVTLHGR